MNIPDEALSRPASISEPYTNGRLMLCTDTRKRVRVTLVSRNYARVNSFYGDPISWCTPILNSLGECFSCTTKQHASTETCSPIYAVSSRDIYGKACRSALRCNLLNAMIMEGKQYMWVIRYISVWAMTKTTSQHAASRSCLAMHVSIYIYIYIYIWA